MTGVPTKPDEISIHSGFGTIRSHLERCYFVSNSNILNWCLGQGGAYLSTLLGIIPVGGVGRPNPRLSPAEAVESRLRIVQIK